MTTSGLRWILSLVLACTTACASSNSPQGGADGESHFLVDCDDGCGDGLTCMNAVCTRSCDEHEMCESLASGASCIGLALPGEEPANDPPRCDVACQGRDDCDGLADTLGCVDGYCRTVQVSANDNRPEGAACETADQCASGICEGLGCGPGTFGVCASHYACHQDLSPYCGCDGETFNGSGNCPGSRFAYRGFCECRPEGIHSGEVGRAYSPCCEGLTEVPRMVRVYQNGEPTCIQPIGQHVYACVAGTCGDGTCEPGEAGPCGCEADCPDAAADNRGGFPGDPCLEHSDCASNICEGRGCEPALPGTCAPLARDCTADESPHCGCDGETFTSSSSCPGQRFARRGACECHGEGRYQSGKEGSYLPCCEGLTEVLWQVPATQGDGERICAEPPGHREYACVSGTCGDGTCEPGEDGPCGCEEDCPGAAL